MNGSHPPEQAAVAFNGSELADRLLRGDLPVVRSPDPLAPGDQCHFVTPVRFGRRRADHYGHLLLTSGWLKFRGTLDISVTWSEVSGTDRATREIVISLQDSRRLLRFLCHSEAEAERGVAIARHLAQSAGVHTADAAVSFHHAAL
jgi:hypothetical protein